MRNTNFAFVRARNGICGAFTMSHRAESGEADKCASQNSPTKTSKDELFAKRLAEKLR